MLSMASALEKAKKTRCGVFLEVVTISTDRNSENIKATRQISVKSIKRAIIYLIIIDIFLLFRTSNGECIRRAIRI